MKNFAALQESFDLTPCPSRHLHPLAPPARAGVRRPAGAVQVSSPVGCCAKGVVNLKEAGGQRPPASLSNSPLPRDGTLASTSYLAGGGEGVGVSSDRLHQTDY